MELLCGLLFLFGGVWSKTLVAENGTFELQSDDVVPFNWSAPASDPSDDEPLDVTTSSDVMDELTGFKPQTNYMAELCGLKRILHDRNAILMSLSRNGLAPSDAKCDAGVESAAYSNYGLVITFKSLAMTQPTAGSCDRVRLDLFNGKSILPVYRLNGAGGICGDRTTSPYFVTTTNFLTLEFNKYIISPTARESFTAVITPYHTGRCASDEFKCANGFCVQNNMLCDGYNNCGDDSDEKSCGKLALSIAAIIGIAVGGVVLVAIVITCICCKCCCSVYTRLN